MIRGGAILSGRDQKIAGSLRVCAVMDPPDGTFVAAENLRDASGEAVDVVSAPDETVADLSDLLVTFRRECRKHLDSGSQINLR